MFLLSVRIYKNTVNCFEVNNRSSNIRSLSPTIASIGGAVDNECNAIHLAFVVAGSRAVRDFLVVLKSILYHRHSPLHIHFISDSIAEKSLSILMKTWALPFVNYSFYSIDSVKSSVSWIPNAHYSGIFGLMKLTLPSLLSIDKVIVMDIDVTIMSNIHNLWKLFAKVIKHNKLIGLVENQSDWYLGTIWNDHKPWPALGRGFNTGIMLMDLRAMRKYDWFNKCIETVNTMLPIHGYTSLADQDIINSVIKLYPDIVYQLPCTWNVQLSDHSRSETCYMKNSSGYDIVHWNSPLKLQTACKNAPFFRQLHYSFMQYNGAHLSQSLIYCKTLSAQSTIDGGNCQIIKYRTHLYFYGTNYNNNVDPFDVTLVSQLSMDRLHTLNPLLQHWVGPISLALYATDAETMEFLDYINRLPPIIKNRTNLSVHVVYKDNCHLYPVNYLRNVALNASNTPFVFFNDIDFVPMLKSYSYLKEAVMVLRPDTKKRALIVPAFESITYKLSYPKDKQTLLSPINIGKIISFRQDVWEQGHAATNYYRWYTADHPYKIHWTPNYEPYIVVAKNITRFDERFTGFGWNKVSHMIQLDAEGYEFVVLPDAFTIHLPHTPSVDILRYRNNKDYRNTQNRLKETFINELIKKYGKKAQKYLTSI